MKSVNKVKLPIKICKWLNYCKATNVSIKETLVVSEVVFYNYANQVDKSYIRSYMSNPSNQEKVITGILHGFDEEEPLENAKFVVVTRDTVTSLKMEADRAVFVDDDSLRNVFSGAELMAMGHSLDNNDDLVAYIRLVEE